MKLPKVDLNLFVVFDTVYTERNLTRAAKVLHITQPAVSNALKRLRAAFGDPLFVRTPRGVAPTPVADNIAGRVKEALNMLNLSLTEGEKFQPQKSEKVFALGVHDIDEALVLPQLMERLDAATPGISLECISVPRNELEGELASGSLDFALDVPLFSVPLLCRQLVSAERYVCAMRPGHPMAAEPLTLERYLQLHHVHVSTRRRGVGHIDRALERLGRARNIRLRMMSYMAAPQVVASTDLVLTIPRTLASMYGLAALELPFEVGTLDQYLYWHKNADEDRANTWMRGILLDLMGKPGAHPVRKRS
ncbi:MAG: LysR family transcriptional regulator [Xanthomonadales bacterium]|jgi:DNA-binding transcriptional LysR family regulator|nr:LysR family transcriptional regulator [Xanthomonadales bacterium]